MRFPGFDGEWKTIKLGDITSWSSGGTPSKENPLFWNGQIPWISASSMRGFVYSDSEIKITESGLKKGSRLAKKGSLLILVRGSMLFNKIPIGIVSRDLAFNQDVKSIIVHEQSSSEYILNWFSAFEPKILNMVTGTGIGAGKLDLADLKSLEVKIPILSEQKEISHFLSLINERITSSMKIITKVKSQMQVLEDLLLTGKLRLNDNDGNSFNNWTQEKLSNIGKTYNGLSGKTKDDFGSGKKYIQYKQIFDSSRINICKCAFVNISANENQNAVQFGDIFFTVSSETPEEIGMSSVLLEDVENVFLNSFCFGFRTHSFEKLIPEFSQFFFRSKVFRNEIVKLAQGSTRYNISKSEFLKLKVILPSKDEQVKIANTLASVDKKIETEKKILAKYETQKKYLLANLFA
ncbi:restriction endonuclease subunit S [Epilithonimonas sp. UC225_85]|uniref:restriction endonuclease subunit S n=1 Tax=Epilithonimonas sp. UC225_85 TaxID=3350167 RepID=UPI0036D374EC